MAAAVPIIQGVAAVAAVAGTVSQMQSSRQARKEQQNAAKVANAAARIRQQRAIRQRVAQMRQQQAAITAAGFNTGAQGSTPQLGAAGGLATDTAERIGFSQQQMGFEEARVNFMNRSAEATSRGQQLGALFGGIQQVAGMFLPTE